MNRSVLSDTGPTGTTFNVMAGSGRRRGTSDDSYWSDGGVGGDPDVGKDSRGKRAKFGRYHLLFNLTLGVLALELRLNTQRLL